MYYLSTRGHSVPRTFCEILLEGLAPDGGLYLPTAYPQVDVATLESWRTLYREQGYAALAFAILSRYISDIPAADLKAICDKTYTAEVFGTEQITPVRQLEGELYVEGLSNGPTIAFKDMAMQLLGNLFEYELGRRGEQLNILGATSGDTGSATMAGFQDMPGIKVIVFYPEHGVSPVQQAQMQRMPGRNLRAVAIRGDFDQAQQGVKQIFARARELAPQCLLSSANSINIGRLIPQMAYYLHAAHQIGGGKAPLFSVPTGNFGDIFAGALAGQSGLPLSGLICATNDNQVLKDALDTGVYDRRQPLHKTLSPSMDILVSSNFERALYTAAQGDAAQVQQLMAQLEQQGHMALPAGLHGRLRAQYRAAACTDQQAQHTMRHVYERHGYLLDPHTACAWLAADELAGAYPAAAPQVVLSTASPYKFPQAALEALGIPAAKDVQDQLALLEKHTGVPLPRALDGLFDRPVLHDEVIDPGDMAAYVQRRAHTW